ncbi:hypothetical protein PMAYCL1PPCAC_33157, partial [Pristionchus mayeri]
SDWTPVSPQLMNYYSVNRTISEGLFPHMKNGYKRNVVEYYENLFKYDEMLSQAKKTILNGPVEYKSLSLKEDFEEFRNSFDCADVFIVLCAVVAGMSFAYGLFKKCNRKVIICEREPLLDVRSKKFVISQ